MICKPINRILVLKPALKFRSQIPPRIFRGFQVITLLCLIIFTCCKTKSQNIIGKLDNGTVVSYCTPEFIQSTIEKDSPVFTMFWAVWCSASKLTLTTYLIEGDVFTALKNKNYKINIICAGGDIDEITRFYNSSKIALDTVYILTPGEYEGGNGFIDKAVINNLIKEIFPDRESENRMPQYLLTDSNGKLLNNEPKMSLTEILKFAQIK